MTLDVCLATSNTGAGLVQPEGVWRGYSEELSSLSSQLDPQMSAQQTCLTFLSNFEENSYLFGLIDGLCVC